MLCSMEEVSELAVKIFKAKPGVSMVGKDLLPFQPDEVAHEHCRSHNDHHIIPQSLCNNFDAFVSSLIDMECLSKI